MTLFLELLMKFSAASLKLFLAAASNRCEPRVPFRLQIGCLKLIDFFYIYSSTFFFLFQPKNVLILKEPILLTISYFQF